jgi:hypothetical protein
VALVGGLPVTANADSRQFRREYAVDWAAVRVKSAISFMFYIPPLDSMTVKMSTKYGDNGRKP